MEHPLRRYRNSNGNMTQADLARLLGVTSVSVSRWETGQRQIRGALLAKISQKTGLHPRDLRPDLAALLEPAE